MEWTDSCKRGETGTDWKKVRGFVKEHIWNDSQTWTTMWRLGDVGVEGENKDNCDNINTKIFKLKNDWLSRSFGDNYYLNL